MTSMNSKTESASLAAGAMTFVGMSLPWAHIGRLERIRLVGFGKLCWRSLPRIPGSRGSRHRHRLLVFRLRRNRNWQLAHAVGDVCLWNLPLRIHGARTDGHPRHKRWCRHPDYRAFVRSDRVLHIRSPRKTRNGSGPPVAATGQCHHSGPVASADRRRGPALTNSHRNTDLLQFASPQCVAMHFFPVNGYDTIGNRWVGNVSYRSRPFQTTAFCYTRKPPQAFPCAHADW